MVTRLHCSPRSRVQHTVEGQKGRCRIRGPVLSTAVNGLVSHQEGAERAQECTNHQRFNLDQYR